MSDEIKDLYTLIGRYEESSRNVIARLDSIDERLAEGGDTFTEIQERCAERLGKLNALGEDVDALKVGQLSSKTKAAIAVPLIDVLFKYGGIIFSGIMRLLNGG